MPEPKDITVYPQEAQEYIKELREEARTNRLKVAERDTSVAEALAKITALEATTKSAGETATAFATLQDQHAQALAKAASDQLKASRYKVALEQGLPISLADRLQGDSEDALKADAEELKKFAKATGTRQALDRTTVTDSQVRPQDALKDAIRSQMEE